MNWTPEQIRRFANILFKIYDIKQKDVTDPTDFLVQLRNITLLGSQ